MTPEGPPCPECGEPVGAVAAGCVSCGAELDPGDRGAVSATVVDLGEPVSAGAADEQGDASGTWTPGRLLDGPDRHTGRPPRTVRTRAVTAAVGGVAGLLAALLALLATASAWGLLAGPVVLVAVVRHVRCASTAPRAVRRAVPLAGPLGVAVPAYWLGASPPGAAQATTLLVVLAAGAMGAAIGAVPLLVLLLGVFGRGTP